MPVVCVILLMVIFRFPECLGPAERSRYFVSLLIQYRYILFRNFLFFLCRIENAGQILRTDVRSLAVGLGKVVNFKKQFHQILVRSFQRIVNDFRRFEMARSISAHFFIAWMRDMPAHETYRAGNYARRLHKIKFGAPKTSAGKVRSLIIFLLHFYSRSMFWEPVREAKASCLSALSLLLLSHAAVVRRHPRILLPDRFPLLYPDRLHGFR